MYACTIRVHILRSIEISNRYFIVCMNCEQLHYGNFYMNNIEFRQDSVCIVILS